MALSVYVHYVGVELCGGDRKKRSLSEPPGIHIGGDHLQEKSLGRS